MSSTFSSFLKTKSFFLLRGIYRAVPGSYRLFSFISNRTPRLFNLVKCLYKRVQPSGEMLISCQGNRMYLNPKDEVLTPHLLVNQVYEPFETEVFRQLIEPGMTVLDIGANIGYYTLIAAQAVGERGHVYAFEPGPVNYDFLVRNINGNQYSNVVPIRKAVSDQKGTIQLFFEEHNPAATSLSPQNVPAKAHPVEVETLTLDELFAGEEGFRKVHLIKMDAQGAEGRILQGATRLIKANALKLLMEFWPRGLKNLGTDPLSFLRELQALGFEIRLVNEDRGRLESIDFREMLAALETTKAAKDYVTLLAEKK